MDNMLLLHEHADTNLPNEAIALIFGNISGTSIFAKHVELVSNSSSTSVTSFKVDPEVQYRLLVEAEERNEELVCIFHSHPAPPYPSKTDVRNMELNPVVWLIASKNSGSWESMAYIFVNDEVEEVGLVLS
jgi:proteasome lid subunit RPN8/RPN11